SYNIILLSAFFMCVLDLLVVFFIFFFYCSRPPRALHSFPTRRSSDLSAGGFEAFSELLSNLPPDIPMAIVLVQHLDPKHSSLLRSEEHTSELQSLRHLVCRLLLEKKKN